MSNCGGRGQCGCGKPYCWWVSWGLLWWLIAFEMTEALGHKRRNRFCEYTEQLEECT